MKAGMDKDTHYDVLVVGGGAAGMMAAGTAAAKGRRVLLLEQNRRLGEKLRISGGGRCNILNAEQDEKKLLAAYGESEQFLYSTFSQFGMQDTWKFFEANSLPLKIERNNRAFPKSEKAADVVHVLEDYLRTSGVEVKTGVAVSVVLSEGDRIISVSAGGKHYTADSYIFATGGRSHPETGSTGDGFNWLRTLGHTVKDPTPTIVPLRTKEPWTRALAGMAAQDVRITFAGEKGTKIKKDQKRDGVVLFTHVGISGPTVLNAAGMVADLLHEGSVTAHIDLFPKLDVGGLDRHITEIFDGNKNKMLRNACREFLPAGMTDVLLAQVPDIDPEREVHSVTRDERKRLVHFFKDISLTVTGLMGFERAVVADGGIPLSEVDMRTMRSLRIKNLLVTGDLLHITRPSGGYSLQLCWTTGYVAGLNS